MLVEPPVAERERLAVVDLVVVLALAGVAVVAALVGEREVIAAECIRRASLRRRVAADQIAAVA